MDQTVRGMISSMEFADNVDKYSVWIIMHGKVFMEEVEAAIKKEYPYIAQRDILPYRLNES